MFNRKFFSQILKEAIFAVLAAVSITSGILLAAIILESSAGNLVPIATNTIQLCHISLSTALSVICINFTGYFSNLILVRKRIGELTIGFCIICAAICAYLILLPLTFSYPIQFALGTTLAGLISAALTGLYRQLKSQFNTKQQNLCIVLDLLPYERAPIIEDLAASKLLHKLKIISRKEFEQLVDQDSYRQIEMIVISEKSCSENAGDDDCLIKAHMAGIAIIDYRLLCDQLSGRVRLNHLESVHYILSTSRIRMIKLYLELKNITEPIIATMLLLLISPLAILITICIRFSGSRSVITSEKVSGLNQKPFNIYSFQTYKTENKSKKLFVKHSAEMTRLGKILTNTGLHKIPQLWNIIRTEMSFTGPQPFKPSMAIRLSERIPQFAIRSLIKPGITGWAQVNCNNTESADLSGFKLEFDLFYIRHLSLLLDFKILARSLMTFIKTKSEKSENTLFIELESDLSEKTINMMGMLAGTLRN